MSKDSIGKYTAAIDRNVQSILSYKLKEYDINNGQYDFFLYITNHEGITQKELSQGLYIGKATTAKAIKNLEDSGYIKRVKDENDKRFNRLYLTEKGVKVAPMIRGTFSELVDIYSQDLSEAEYDIIVSALKIVLKNVCIEKSKIGSDL